MFILRLPLALCLNFAIAVGVAGPADSQISEQPIKVGVITDMNGPLASATGRGSVEAARMAAEEFGFSVSGRPVEILSADHQNKPDIGAAIVRRWFDVEGINGVYIGPSDLGLSYGLVPKLDRDEPEILNIYEKIVKECGKRGLHPGIHCGGAEGAVRAINMGFKLVTLSNESGLMMTYAKMQVAQTRKDSGGKA